MVLPVLFQARPYSSTRTQSTYSSQLGTVYALVLFNGRQVWRDKMELLTALVLSTLDSAPIPPSLTTPLPSSPYFPLLYNFVCHWLGRAEDTAWAQACSGVGQHLVL